MPLQDLQLFNPNRDVLDVLINQGIDISADLWCGVFHSQKRPLLDEGMGFSLVPWKPVLEQRLGQQLVATMRGGSVSWKIGRRRYLSIQ